jgi:hypothetical protein
MIRRALDWLGAARRENDEVNADAVRIASLEKTLASVRGDLARAIQGNAAWAAKFADFQNKLDNVNELYAADIPLIEYARRQKANRAKYDAKRRAAK